MCATCGCGDDGNVRLINLSAPGHDHQHGDIHQHGRGHSHSHDHTHGDEHPESHTVTLEQDVLARNDLLAERNRKRLRDNGIVAINLMSSPGSGKTTLLERTVRELGGGVSVIEGDQETRFDAERIRATGVPVVQINTGAGCHLDAAMLAGGLDALAPEPGSVVFVENVGNLVCPALFDLGEHRRVVIMSVTEGADKPLKYPHMFRTADLVLLNKIDLQPYVDFDPGRFLGYTRQVNPDCAVLPVSATRGDGLPGWLGWLTGLRRQPRPDQPLTEV